MCVYFLSVPSQLSGGSLVHGFTCPGFTFPGFTRPYISFTVIFLAEVKAGLMKGILYIFKLD